MKASKFTEAQKAFILKRGDAGTTVAEICRKAGISQATSFNWKKKYGGLLPDEMRRLKALEDENTRRKRIVIAVEWTRHASRMADISERNLMDWFGQDILRIARGYPDMAIQETVSRIIRLHRHHGENVRDVLAKTATHGRVPAGEIEAAVIDQLRAVFRQPEIVAGTWKAASNHADDITEADARAALQELDPLWDELFPAEQARIVALLVERVDIGTNGLNVRLRVDGLGGLAREMLAGDMGAAA